MNGLDGYVHEIMMDKIIDVEKKIDKLIKVYQNLNLIKKQTTRKRKKKEAKQ